MFHNSLNGFFHDHMPKVDLHCHLNGSISSALLAHLKILARRAEEETNKSSGDKTEGENNLPCSSTSVNETTVFQSSAGALDDYVQPAERMKCCFDVFDTIYKVMTNAAFTRLAVQDLLFHSAAELVFLLEIRTSLRDGLYNTARAAACRDKAESLTKRAYVETVIATVGHLLTGGVVDFETGELIPCDARLSPVWFAHLSDLYGTLFDDKQAVSAKGGEIFFKKIRKRLTGFMHVRLLLSIDRGQSAAAAAEVVALAKQLQVVQVERFIAALTNEPKNTLQLRREARQVCWVTGIDFSGNCYKNRFADFLPALKEARRHQSLGITLHAGEKEDPEELAEMIAFAPDRWSHLAFTDRKSLEAIIQRSDPIELCITSNTVTGGYSDIARHQLSGIIAEVRERAAIVPSTRIFTSVFPPPISSFCPLRSSCSTSPFNLVNILQEGSNATDVVDIRFARRAFRWGKKEWLVGQFFSPVPNVSFSTGNRGVYATSITNEFYQFKRHPTFERTTMGDRIFASWILQRAALVHAFDIPHEIIALCENDWPLETSAAQLAAQVRKNDEYLHSEVCYYDCIWLIREFDIVTRLFGMKFLELLRVSGT